MTEARLNAAQQQAVNHSDGPALVIAGAGTGKTRVITERIARLIGEGIAEPGEVLALTFTEKAAREMAERLYDLVGWRSYQVAVMTFHAFGAELLGRYGLHIGRSIRGGLINDTQKALLLQQHLDRINLSYYGPHSALFEFLEAVVAYIGQLQNAGVDAAKFRAYVETLQPGPELHRQDIAEYHDLAQLYSLYEAIKQETGTFDFQDQLQIPLQILQQKPNLAARLRRQYRYVLVDEYQDTNSLQDQLLRSFIPSDGNIFAVGDDDQAIYGFRGAQIGNILSFADHFQVKRPLALTQNYRSGQEILDASYRLISHNNPERLEARLGIDKRLQSQVGSAEIDFRAYDSAALELQQVVAELERRLEAGVSAAELAVLSATHAPLGRLAKLLRSRGLSFALSTTVNIFEQPELNQLWYLLEWVGQRIEESSLAHVLLSPFMGWRAQDYRNLLRQSQDSLTGLEETLRVVAESGDELAAATVAKLDLWRQWAAQSPVSHLAYRLVFETGVADRLRAQAEDHPRIRQVFEDLGQLLGQMQDYEAVARDSSLLGYLQSFPKPPDLQTTEPAGDSEGIQLLTVHAAKGLEFDTVYLIGCTQRNWAPRGSGGWEVPVSLVEDAPKLPPEHELRRLMYVAATRAKRRLVVSAASATASGSRQTISPFIAELFGSMPKIASLSPSAADGVEKAVQNLAQFYPLRSQSDSKLPFEAADGWLELGVSALAAYQFCPYDFFLEQVLGIKQPFGPQLAFGTALHGAIQAYYQAHLRGEEPAVEELRQRLDELWNDRGYATRKQAETARQAAREALDNFVARERLATHKVVASELPIKLELSEAKLRINGRIDAVVRHDGGSVELRDFKTGRKTDAEAVARSARNSFQLRSYALAYRQMTGASPQAVTLDYVVTGVEGQAELSERILDNHRSKLVQMAADIRARHFSPKNTRLHQCAAIRYYGTGEEDELELLQAEAGSNENAVPKAHSELHKGEPKRASA